MQPKRFWFKMQQCRHSCRVFSWGMIQSCCRTPFKQSLMRIYSYQGTHPNNGIRSHWFWSIWYQFFPLKLNVWPDFVGAEWNGIGNMTQFFIGLCKFNKQILNFKIIWISWVLFYCCDLNLIFLLSRTPEMTDCWQNLQVDHLEQSESTQAKQ